jgi:hypothetical protein
MGISSGNASTLIGFKRPENNAASGQWTVDHHTIQSYSFDDAPGAC